MGTQQHIPADQEQPTLVAPLWHTVVLVVAILGFSLMQSRQQPALEGIQLRSRLPIYGTMVGFELFIFAYVWLLGLRLTRTPLRDIIGGRWPNAAAVMRDVLAALVFWIVVAVVLVVMGKVLGVNNTGLEAVGALLPQGPLEITAWIALCVTAGFCEELVFRGYLQRQFSALTGRVDLSIALQAIVFGIGHMYQGFKGVITIALYGALFGILAVIRKSLRPGMIQHASQDMFSGLVGGFLLRRHHF